MKTINIVNKFLAIALGGLSVVSPLEAEWGSGDHLGAITDSIQTASVLAQAATTDQGVKNAIVTAADAAPAILALVVGLVNEVKAAVEHKPAAPAA